MTETPHEHTSSRETRPASSETVKELLDSLVGIASTRVVLGGDDSVNEVHVLALPDATREGVTQAVVSALRARFDMSVDAGRVFVARIRDAGAPAAASDSPAPEGAGAPPPPDRTLPPARPLFAPPGESREVGPPPWPERAPDESGGPGPAGASSSSRRTPAETAKTLDSRLLFLGHRTSKRRFRAVEVAVDLQWRGMRHRGAASVRDQVPDRLEAPALATLRALDAALERRPKDEHRKDVTLTLRGVEIVEALGQRHVMVSIVAELGRSRTPLTGTVVVDDSVELATILATLQATDRRVRAVLLNHLPGNGGPPKRT